MSQKGQSSLEYLILVTVFFSILGIVLPVASNTVDSFLAASDDLLAKQIFEDLSESISLMNFLGEGSEKTFEYHPIKNISFSSSATKVIISTDSKSFEVETNSIQVIPKTTFEKSFFVTIKKNAKGAVVSFLD